MSGDAMLRASGQRNAFSSRGRDDDLSESPRLVCVSGPASGTEFPLVGDELEIGRALENEISIPDTSVSRKHARLFKQGQAWICADMGSGNGTLLNGQDLRGDQILRDGDVLTLGDTELSCVMPDPTQSRSLQRRVSQEGALPGRSVAARSGSRSGSRSGRYSEEELQTRKRSRRLLLLATVLVLAGLGVFAAVKAQMRQREALARTEAMAAEEERSKIAIVFQRGKNLVREGRWEEAKTHFLEVQRAAPDFPTLEQFLLRAEKEIPNEQALNRARQALERGALAEAAAALRLVPADTQLFETQRSLTASLNEQATRKLRDAQLGLRQLPRGAAALPKLQALKAVLSDVVAALPDSREPRVVLEDVQARLQSVVLVKPVRRKSPARPWEDAIGLFIDGELEGALETAESCSKAHRRCAALTGQLRSFELLSARVDKLDLAGLLKLIQVGRSISGSERSDLTRDAETRAGVLLYNRASAAKAAGQWPKALDYANRTLSADPTHGGAKALLKQIHDKAKEVYLSAYSLKDAQPEEAVKRFREVLQMTLRGDEYNSKAANWLRQLER